MISWGINHLETVFGKTVTGIIGIFALGVFVMWAIPKYVVTTEIFEREVTKIENRMANGYKCQDRNILEFKKEYWEGIRYDLQCLGERLKEDGESLEIHQINIIENANEKLKNLGKELSAVNKFIEDAKL